MENGTIKSVIESRGYGFVRSEVDGREVFFHCSDLSGLDFDNTLMERRVEFTVANTAKGERATNVKAAS